MHVMKFLVNVGFIIALILDFLFIVIPAWTLMVAQTVPMEDGPAVAFWLIIAFLVLSPVTTLLNKARKFYKDL